MKVQTLVNELKITLFSKVGDFDCMHVLFPLNFVMEDLSVSQMRFSNHEEREIYLNMLPAKPGMNRT